MKFCEIGSRVVRSGWNRGSQVYYSSLLVLASFISLTILAPVDVQALSLRVSLANVSQFNKPQPDSKYVCYRRSARSVVVSVGKVRGLTFSSSKSVRTTSGNIRRQLASLNSKLRRARTNAKRALLRAQIAGLSADLRAVNSCTRALTLPEHGASLFCPDFNRDGAVDIRDFRGFLTAFFQNHADLNRDGVTSNVDYVEYLAAYAAAPRNPGICASSSSVATSGALSSAPANSSIATSEAFSSAPMNSSSNSSSSSAQSSAPPLPPLPQAACPGLEGNHVYPVSTFAGGTVCPSGTSRVFYVSSSLGNDSNEGLSPSSPLATISRAIVLGQSYRNGSVWILLRRGDSFNTTGTVSPQMSGPSASNPTVLSAYGERLLERPKILPAAGVGGISTSRVFNFTVSGLHIETQPGLGGTGYYALDYLSPDGRFSEQYPSPASPQSGYLRVDAPANLVVEDCFIRGFGTNIIVQGLSGPFGWNEFNPATNPGVVAHAVVNGRSYVACHQGNLSAEQRAICDRDNDTSLCTGDSNEQCDLMLYLDYLMDGIRIQHNVLVDSATAATAHSQGIYTNKVMNLSIEDNVLDISGWYLDRSGQLANSRRATIFNHHLYLNSASGPTIVRDNILADASSHGMQARSGGIVERNLFLRDPLAMFVAKSSIEAFADFRSIVRYNIAEEGNDINPTTDRGFGIDHNTARHSLIEDNIVAHLSPSSLRYNNHAFSVNCASDRTVPCETTLRNNLVYNWSNAAGGGVGILVYDNNLTIGDDDRITLTGNTVANFGSFDFSFMYFQDAVPSRSQITSNRYLHPSLPQGAGTPRANFNYAGSAHTYPVWRDAVEPTSVAEASPNFPDPCRTVGSYYYDRIQGSGHLDCSQIFDDNLYAAFMTRARARSRFIDYTDTKATTVIDYIRAGFGKGPAPR